jgi:two-component system response regulator YesN
VVVLTMHRDFDLIQEAMRLGVDDYITKEQFDLSSIDGILESLRSRLRNRPEERQYTSDAISCLYYPDGAPQAERLDEYFTRYENRSDEAPLPRGAVRIDAQGIKGMNYRQLLEELRMYVEAELFYCFVPGRGRYVFSRAAPRQTVLPGSARLSPAGDLRRRLERLTQTADWILDGNIFNELITGIPAARMSREQLAAFFYQPVLRASQYIKMDAERYFAKTRTLRWWYEWKLWLLDIREQLREYMSAESAAVHRIHQAMRYTQEHFLENLHINDVIKVAAMSRSHFSPLFKEIAGLTFVDYLKTLRIDYAKRLLVETGRSVSQIGEDSGYPDERYFRRLFLKTVGVSPTRYRHDARSGGASGGL